MWKSEPRLDALTRRFFERVEHHAKLTIYRHGPRSPFTTSRQAVTDGFLTLDPGHEPAPNQDPAWLGAGSG
ncbi:MAG: hypothetical protein ACLQIB_27420 [Isosphaeraceae bacterium]